MLNPHEGRNLKKSYKRLLIFLISVVLFDVFIAFLFFKFTKIHSVLCGFIIGFVQLVANMLIIQFLNNVQIIREKLEK